MNDAGIYYSRKDHAKLESRKQTLRLTALMRGVKRKPRNASGKLRGKIGWSRACCSNLR